MAPVVSSRLDLSLYCTRAHDLYVQEISLEY